MPLERKLGQFDKYGINDCLDVKQSHQATQHQNL
jgi:hypothetical protein